MLTLEKALINFAYATRELQAMPAKIFLAKTKTEAFMNDWEKEDFLLMVDANVVHQSYLEELKLQEEQKKLKDLREEAELYLTQHLPPFKGKPIKFQNSRSGDFEFIGIREGRVVLYDPK